MGKSIVITLAKMSLPEHLRETERSIIEAYLQAFQGNKTDAAKYLTISRTTLISRVKRLGMRHWIREKGDTAQ